MVLVRTALSPKHGVFFARINDVDIRSRDSIDLVNRVRELGLC
jgi:hypothetical protein